MTPTSAAGAPRERVLPQRPEHSFDEPWQARAFALAVLTVEQADQPWESFRVCLKRAIATDPSRPYWESWLAALEAFVADLPDPPRPGADPLS